LKTHGSIVRGYVDVVNQQRPALSQCRCADRCRGTFLKTGIGQTAAAARLIHVGETGVAEQATQPADAPASAGQGAREAPRWRRPMPTSAPSGGPGSNC